jgi:hypothetical protein
MDAKTVITRLSPIAHVCSSAITQVARAHTTGGARLRSSALVRLAVATTAAVMAWAALGVAQDPSVAEYTGCLRTRGNANGTIYALTTGSVPMVPCMSSEIQIHLSGGDITSVIAGDGLVGGSSNGAATLSLQSSYQLPQTCAAGQITTWNGAGWVCGSDQTSAGFAVSAQVNPTFGDRQDVPNSFDTIGHIDLPAGSYAISAKVNLISSTGDTFSSVECRLIAEDDVDEGNLGDTDGDNLRGEITLQLAHEFSSPGAASVVCTDNESSEDPTYNGAAWNNLRITAIRLGSLTSGPA